MVWRGLNNQLRRLEICIRMIGLNDLFMRIAIPGISGFTGWFDDVGLEMGDSTT